MLATKSVIAFLRFLTFADRWYDGQTPFSIYTSTVSSGASDSGTAPTCRCLSTDACWPSAAAFADLQKQLTQPILSPQPLAAACYPASAPSGDCDAVKELWTFGKWRSEHVGQMQNPNFEAHIFPNGSISTCPLNASLGIPCGQGSVPVSAVDARSPEDIIAAVNFVKKYNLRLVIKNTGHDYLGRSTARGAFMVWTHHLKNITYHEEFQPAGSPPDVVLNDVITLGAGVQWHEAYDAAYAHNRVLVGGLSPDVSVGAAGGWIQGGGHSALSPKYGLGVDNAVEITVVTSEGAHLTTNAHQNADLFWALRGGGGGTYGIITSVSYQTHPSTPLSAGFFLSYINTTNLATPSPLLKKLFTEFVRLTPAMADAGWGGYAMLIPVAPTNAPALQFFYIAKNVSLEDAAEIMDPFFAFAQNLVNNPSVDDGGSLNVTFAGTVPFESFQAWETLVFRSNASTLVGGNVEIGSRLLTRALIEEDHKAVANAVLGLPNPQFYLLAGGAVAKVDPDSAGLNPAWRSALVHTVFGEVWEDGAPVEKIIAAQQLVKRGVGTLEKLSPDTGAYFNEASFYESNPKQTFFGSHYEKLLAIKEKYDPHDLFVVIDGVGSEKWDAGLNCRV